MKNIGEGYWNYNGCDVYLAEHPKLQGKYEIYKGCDFVSRAYNLKEAKQIIIEKFGKMSGGIRANSGNKPKYSEQTKTVAFRCPMSKVDELKLIVKSKLSEWLVK
jgi:hypothetical protein